MLRQQKLQYGTSCITRVQPPLVMVVMLAMAAGAGGVAGAAKI